jgi:MFS-type transporter involved in bile tolerance (Atg22 family)
VLFFGFGNFFGLLIGGGGGKFLYRLDHRYPSLLAGIAAIVACIPFWAILNLLDESSPPWFIFAITIVAGTGSGATGPIVKAVLQNVTLPNTRGQAFALINLFDDFGKGLGPFLVSFLITAFKSRTTAFNFGTLGWVFCGILNLAVFFTVNADESRVQELLLQEMRGRERLIVPDVQNVS